MSYALLKFACFVHLIYSAASCATVRLAHFSREFHILLSPMHGTRAVDAYQPRVPPAQEQILHLSRAWLVSHAHLMCISFALHLQITHVSRVAESFSDGQSLLVCLAKAILFYATARNLQPHPIRLSHNFQNKVHKSLLVFTAFLLPFLTAVGHSKYWGNPFGQRTRRGRCPIEHRGEFPSV